MHTPGAEAPFCLLAERPKAEALGYLEATATATAKAKATATAKAKATAEAMAAAETKVGGWMSAVRAWREYPTLRKRREGWGTRFQGVPVLGWRPVARDGVAGDGLIIAEPKSPRLLAFGWAEFYDAASACSK